MEKEKPLDFFTHLLRKTGNLRMDPIAHWINYANIKLQDISDSHDQVRFELQQLSSEMYVSASKEEHDMSEAINELKIKANQIDTTVRKLETDVAVLKNTMELKFESVNSTLSEIKSSLDSIKNDGITKRRYTITTTITVVSIVISIAVGIAAWINALK